MFPYTVFIKKDYQEAVVFHDLGPCEFEVLVNMCLQTRRKFHVIDTNGNVVQDDSGIDHANRISCWRNDLNDLD